VIRSHLVGSLPSLSQPKSAASQKAAAKKELDRFKQKKNDALCADKTFGLKNKKKSKAVQNFVKETVSALKGDSLRQAHEAKAKAKAKKELKEMEAKEMQLLFGGVEKVIRDASGKKMTRAEIAKQKEKEAAEKEAERKKKEWWDALPLVDKIEHQRSELDTLKCTKLTEEIFNDWKARKKAAKDAEMAQALADAMKKKKGNKSQVTGSVATGRYLFETNADLFKDDDGAVDEKEDLKDLVYDGPDESDEDSDDGGGLGYSDDDSSSDDDDDGEAKAAKKASKAADADEQAAAGDAAQVADASLYMDDAGLDDLDDLDDLEDD
jgi:hypothetical protein